MTKPVDGPITGRWADLRPRSAPSRPHGGIDIAAGVGDVIVAPEAGLVFYFRIRRQEKGQVWKWPLREGGRTLPWIAYAYDLYGAVTVLQSADRARVHLFCHSYFRQLLDMTRGITWDYQEQPEDSEWPVEIAHTFAWPVSVKEGERIAAVGNQGESTGAHCHWEVHNGWAWSDYKDRPDPEKLLEEV